MLPTIRSISKTQVGQLSGTIYYAILPLVFATVPGLRLIRFNKRTAILENVKEAAKMAAAARALINRYGPVACLMLYYNPTVP